ncbi:hypothetical protein [Hyphomicrobium sp. DY-1]|uniref:hypothetical protein n=1 Tax=Hyphomicrobium sp. DY-1 TaxID=3075650 RepID=UPI0039C2506C
MFKVPFHCTLRNALRRRRATGRDPRRPLHTTAEKTEGTRDLNDTPGRINEPREEEALKDATPRKFVPDSFNQWIARILLAAALSYIVPALIIVAPDFARTYVHVWKVVLGAEPDCAYPAPQAPTGGYDCLLPEAPAKRGDRISPQPPENIHP